MSPLDTMPDRCSKDAPPRPLKEYIMSILTPILNESAEALFQTMNVEPLVEKAVSEVVMTEALTPEVLERMKALNDPQVQQVLAGFKKNVENAVQESSQILQNGVADNAGVLLGQVTEKLTDAVKSLIADIPGVGIGMAALQAVDAAVVAAKQGMAVVEEVKDAIKPITAIQSQVDEVTNAVNAATQSAAGAVSAATGQLSAATGQVSEATGQLSEATGQVSEATGQVSEATGQLSEATKVEPEVSVRGGGSRKRRRIQKLSRRIERTLRRVQKKYGLKDKNDFLRRTLRARRMK